MPIGNGPDYYTGINKEEDERVKLGDKVQDWWDSLDDNKKYGLLESYYPERLQLMGMDEAWEELIWEDQLDIYNKENGYYNERNC